MKILFLTDNFPPEANAPATRTYEHCREWADKGIEVTVITCFPNFPQGKIYPGYKNVFKKTENIDGIKVIRVWSYITSNSGFVKRILDYMSYAFMAFYHGLFVKTDIIVATSPQFFTALAGRWLSLFKRVPWVMEVRDLWPESIAAVGVMNKESFLYRFLEWLEMRLYKSGSKIIVVTDTFKKKIGEKGVPSQKIEIVKNGVLIDNFQPGPKSMSLYEQYAIPKNKILIGYIGTHGMAHALDFVLNTIAKLNNDKVHFIFIGDGAEKQNLLDQKQKLGLRNVTMLPFVPKSEIRSHVNLLDIALVNLKKSDTFKTVIPSKIFENAAMLKPILLGVEGESAEIIQHYEAGVCFRPEDEQDMIQKIEYIIQDENYKRFQAGCRKLAEDFDRKKLASDLLRHLYQVHNKNE